MDAPTTVEQMRAVAAIFPGVMSFPSIGSMERSLAKLANDEPSDFISSEISPHELMGFPQVWADEQRWWERYGSAPAAPV